MDKSNFWIVAGLMLVICAILFFIDYNSSKKDKNSRASLIIGHSTVYALILVALFLLHKVPIVIVYVSALVPVAYLGRAIVRKISNRKI